MGRDPEVTPIIIMGNGDYFTVLYYFPYVSKSRVNLHWWTMNDIYIWNILYLKWYMNNIYDICCWRAKYLDI